MSIFGFLRKNKKEKETVIQDVPSQIMELGVEEAIRKKKEEYETEPKEIILEDYTPNIPVEEEVKVEEVPQVQRSEEECVMFLQENCEQIAETKRFTENAKIEYQAVSEYLSDVQKVERMEEGERRLLDDTAKKIIELSKEREEYQKREVSTANTCFRAIRKYEDTIMEELKNMRESESYKKVIQNDMRQLEAEKAALRYDYDLIPEKQRELKKIVLVMAAIVLSLFVLFFTMETALKQNMTVPFIMTVVMAAGILVYIFWEGYRNRYEYIALEKKLNRAIQLLNKVKIKYINNTSSLDYSYSKYNVKNSIEFEYLIKEYTKAKEAERSYESSTGRLHHYREKVIDILQVHEVKDAEVWLHQLSVLLNPTEFEDMKKGLEHRRQDLMDKMDENARFRDQCFEQMHVVLVERPELRDTLVRLMNQYEISL